MSPPNDLLEVVIVDDHSDVRYLLATALEADGRFAVIAEADSAKTGVAAIEQHSPDLAVVDLNLGGPDGASLIRKLRKKGNDLTVVVVTSSDERRDLDAARRAGADDVINKRELTSTMLDRLHELVRQP